MIGEFYDTIDSLKDRKEVRSFFKDLLTADEIATLMRRIEIAVLLSANYKYDEIITILGVGVDKISKVQKCLQQDDSGYKIIVKRLIKNRKQRLKKVKAQEREMSDESVFAGVKKKYSGHFLLNNLLDLAIDKLSKNEKELEGEAILFTPSRAPFKNR
ncbi:MAG: YerC/YecD family TrpR-related protein [Patescibacteria group bacterium]